MQERYGIKKRSKTGIALMIVIGLVGVAAVGYLAHAFSTDRVQYRLLAWDIVADDRVDVTFEVRPIDERPVVCVVRAQDSTRADVGYAEVEIAGGTDYQMVTYPLRTLIPAYTVELLGCGLPGAFDVVPRQFPPGVVPPDQPWSGITLDES